MARRPFLVVGSLLALAMPMQAVNGQGLPLKRGSITQLPAEQMNQELGFDANRFEKLQGEWLTKPMTDDELFTLGKGWVATNAPSSSNTANGLQIMKQLAAKGLPSANLVLGLWGENPDLQLAIGNPRNYLMTAAKAGDPRAQQAFGRKLITPGSPDFDPSAGFAWLSKSVKSGNVAANPDLAISYEYGIGAKPDLASSDQLLKVAAATGQAPLLLDYAEFKVRNGASYSDNAVADLLGRAAAQGNASAQLFLADQALSPNASSDATTNALQTLTALAHEDNDPAMVRLGEYSLSPRFGQSDLAAAESWFQMAAKNGNIEAQAQLGNLFVTRFASEPQKVQLGRQLLLSAASAGDPTAIVASASPAISPELDPVDRYTRALTGFELSGGSAKDAFDSIRLTACDPTSAAVRCEPVPVFYFTNRKAKPVPDGEVSYENLIALDGAMSHGLSLAYAPALTPAASGPPPSNWWDIAKQAVGNVPALNHLWGLFHHDDDQARQQPNKQFELHNRPDTEDLATFVRGLHTFATNSGRPKMFVYVHGFANSFESAVDRMALLSQQYNFPGVPVVFSWASADTQLVDLNSVLSGDITIGYVNDLRMVKRSCDAFQQTLEALVSEFGSGNVMVLAHSMGGELVMDILTACAGGNTWNGSLKLGQLIFAAPDVDQGEFKKEATLVVTRAEGTALYTSQNDIALTISEKLEEPGSRRAGQGGVGLVIAPPVQTIDASQIEGLPGGDPNNHGYVFDARQVREDVVAVLRNTPLDQRDCITDSSGRRDPPGTIIGSDPKEYWIVQPNCQ